jgi:hypothetical protein
MPDGPGFFSELRRRRVIGTAVVYVAAAWVGIEVATTLIPVYGGSNTLERLAVGLILLGLPVAVTVSWLVDITPEGFKRDAGPPGTGLGIDQEPAEMAAVAALAPAPAADKPVPRHSIAVLPFVDMSGEKDGPTRIFPNSWRTSGSCGCGRSTAGRPRSRRSRARTGRTSSLRAVEGIVLGLALGPPTQTAPVAIANPPSRNGRSSRNGGDITGSAPGGPRMFDSRRLHRQSPALERETGRWCIVRRRTFHHDRSKRRARLRRTGCPPVVGQHGVASLSRATQPNGLPRSSSPSAARIPQLSRRC